MTTAAVSILDVPPLVGPVPLDLGEADHLLDLVRQWCGLHAQALVNSDDPSRVAGAGAYFWIARRSHLSEAFELLELLHPEVVRLLLDEVIHPGGGV